MTDMNKNRGKDETIYNTDILLNEIVIQQCTEEE